MKKYLITFLLLFIGFWGYTQNYLITADKCYQQGDYECARENYRQYLLKISNDESIKIQFEKADKCALYRIVADDSYQKKDYRDAKENYEEIIKINPNDLYAKNQLTLCNNILYPEKKQEITNVSQSEIVAINLKVSPENLNFSSSGGTQNIIVITNANTYDISYIPSWCSVRKYSIFFVLICSSNLRNSARNDWIKVKAGDKELKISITQMANVSS
jgi:tetratricopeptide (TPR) repeat protein